MQRSIPSLENIYLGLGFLLLPLVYNPDIMPPFEVPRAWFVWIYTLGLGLIGLWKNKKTYLFRPLIYWIVGYLAFITTGSIWSGKFTDSLWGNPYRADGLISVFALTISALSMGIIRKENTGKIIATGTATGAILLSLWTAIIYLDHRLAPTASMWIGGIGATFGNPNLLAGYLSLSLPLVRLTRKKWLPLIILAILLTGSWGGVLGISIWLMTEWWIRTDRYKWLPAAGMILMICLTAFLYRREFRQNIRPGIITAESRERIWSKALVAIGEKPILGWGWAQFGHVFAITDWPIRYETDAYVDRTHSSILEAGVGGGIGAMFSFVTLFTLACLRLLRGNLQDKAYASLVLIYLIHSQTNVVSIGEEMLAWTAVGLAMPIERKPGRPRK